MSIARRTKLIKSLEAKYKDKFEEAGFSISDVEDVVRSQTEYLRMLMEEGKYIAMRYEGFGKFHVLPGRIKYRKEYEARKAEKRRLRNEERDNERNRTGNELLESEPSISSSGTIQDSI